MRVDIDVSQHQLGWQELLGRVRFAEDNGFVGAWVFDHYKPLYGDPRGPCLEGWTLLAALAASTERIRLGTLVTGVTYRHPSMLAAEAVTVDHVSNGRLEIGLGAAWFDGEHQELGIPFPPTRERVERLEEAVQVLKALMTSDRANFEGVHYELRGASFNPKPVQRPHPPIWIGASGEKRMLPLVGRWADRWHTFGSIESLKRKSEIVDRAATRAGRDGSDIVRATSLSISEGFDRVQRHAAEVAAAGFSCLVVSWPSEGRGRLEEFVAEVMPALVEL
ncbi:MAG: TIGR03560 family F420-dependent LLM class oxidoreductase [Actinomycetota bacterium]